MTDLTPGVYDDMPPSVYHQKRLGVVSNGALKHIDRAPKFYRAWIDDTEHDAQTDALVFGSRFHCALLEPERFAAEYTAEPDFGDCRFKAAKAERDAWRKNNAGKELISATDAETIAGMVDAIKADPLASRLLRDGVPERTVVWKDEETGLICKVRPDLHVEKRGMVVDAKSCQDASPDAFARDVAKHLYHQQDALYRDGMRCADLGVQHFVFLAVEKSWPFLVGVHTLDSDAVARGYSRARTNIDRLAECLRTNKWPGHSDNINTLGLPPWA